MGGTTLEADLRFGAFLEFARGGVCLISVAGEADLHAAPELEQRLAEGCASPGLRQLVVDLSDASFVDSVALSVLISAHRRLKSRGVPVEIVCADANIRRLFSITGLDRLFSVHGSLAELGLGGADGGRRDAASVGERSQNQGRTNTSRA